MKHLLVSAALALTMIQTADAATYTYICRDNHKVFPLTLDTGKDDDCESAPASCSIMWRGTTFHNIKSGDGCRAEYVGNDNGISVDLCTATKGVADLTIGNTKFDCQMRGR